MNSLITLFKAVAVAVQLPVPSTCNAGKTESIMLHPNDPPDRPHDSNIVCKRNACLSQSPDDSTPKIFTPDPLGIHSYKLANTVVVCDVVTEVVCEVVTDVVGVVVCEVVPVDVTDVVGVVVGVVVTVEVAVVVGEVVCDVVCVVVGVVDGVVVADVVWDVVGVEVSDVV